MENLRNVNNDILKEWIEYRKDYFCTSCDADTKYCNSYEELTVKILKNVPKHNQDYVQKQIDLLDKAFMDYFDYWNEKFYRNGFCDGIELLMGALNA